MHCCKKMTDEVHHKKIVEYHAIFRRYCIAEDNFILANFDYCPWCGTKLPERLNEKIFQILSSELDMSYYEVRLFEDSNVPEEFHSDAWWKKRGL